MNGAGRAEYDSALRAARARVFGPGEFVGQESLMRAGEILSLARRAGIGPGVSVLDLCCGVAGPGTVITRVLGGSYLGVDVDSDAVALAHDRAGDLACRFIVSRVPPVPDGPFDVVLLLETMLAFRDKDALVQEIAGVLPPGGRFAFTLEEGSPLTETERARMPAADTVWLIRADDMADTLARAGMSIRWWQDVSDAHAETAEALTRAFLAEASTIAARLGRDVVDDLLAAHRLWSTWLEAGRVRKLAFVAERVVSS